MFTTSAGIGSIPRTSTATASGGVSGSTLTGANSTGTASSPITASITKLLSNPPTAPGAPIPGTLGVYSGGPSAQPKTAATAQQGSPAPQSAPPSPVVNTAAPNPISNEMIDKLKARAAGDMGLPGQLDKATQEIRDRASMGIAGEQAQSRARRGVSGSGIDKWDADQLAASQARDINKVTTDMTVARERDRDALMANIAGLGLSQGAQQLSATGQANAQRNSDRSLGLQEQALADARVSNQWQMQATQDAANRAAQFQNFQTLWNLLN